MKQIMLRFFIFWLMFPVFLKASQGTSEIRSPDGKIAVKIMPGNEINLTIMFLNRPVLKVGNVSMTFAEHDLPYRISSVRTRTVSQVQRPVIREKRAIVEDRFNEMTVLFGSSAGLIIRAYDDGIAYRFFTRFKEDTVFVVNETASLVFETGDSLYVPLIRCRDEKNVDCFHSSFEEDYFHRSPGEISPDQLAYLPFYARMAGGFSVAVTESDLYDYPGMYVSGSEFIKNAMVARFPAFPWKSRSGEMFLSRNW